MGHFEFEMASRLPAEKLYAWYTDFSAEDADLSRKFADGSLVARQVRSTDDGHIICEQRMKIGRSEVPAQYRITKHPENLTYEAEMEIGNLVAQKRLYEFRPRRDGSLIHVKVDYTPKSGLVRFLNAVGLYKRIDRRMSRGTMGGYIKAAEAELMPSGAGR
jgi:hypothetical protein